MKNSGFYLMLLSIALGIAFGIFFPKQAIAFRWAGQIFINLLKLIALPLVFCALVSAIASLAGTKRLGTIGLYTFGYIFLSLTISILIGLTLLNIFKPGIGIDPNLILANAAGNDSKPLEVSSFLLTLFPSNIVDAAAKYEIIPIVLFSIVFAIACIKEGESAKPVIQFFIGLRNVLIKMILWLMYLTPIGLFSLLGNAVAEATLKNALLKNINGLLIFIVIFLSGLMLQVLWQFLLVVFVLRKNPRQFVSSASKALVTVFATSSSVATMPVTMLCAKEQNVSEDVVRFVIPLVSTMNMAGGAMYEAVSALFFCQILGIHLTLLAQIGVFFTAMLAAIGASGIPEGGIVTMVMVLRSVNVPASAIGLLLPFDRILDRFRGMTNIWGDLVCAQVVETLQKKNKKRRHSR